MFQEKKRQSALRTFDLGMLVFRQTPVQDRYGRRTPKTVLFTSHATAHAVCLNRRNDKYVSKENWSYSSGVRPMTLSIEREILDSVIVSFSFPNSTCKYLVSNRPSIVGFVG